MSAISGQYGTAHVGASELLELNKWSLSRKAAVHEYATNATAGEKQTVAGTKSGSGSMGGIYDPSDPPDDHFDEGDLVTLKLYVSATHFYTGSARIENIDLEVDIDEGEIVGWESGFIKHGAWSKPGA